MISIDSKSQARRIAAQTLAWLPGLPRIPSPHVGPRFLAPPKMIVLHSGEQRANVAGYLENPDKKVSAHFAWSTKIDGFAQMVPLDHEALHAGCGAREKCRHYREKKCTGPHEGQRVNAISWGIELPGPWNQIRSDEEHRALIALLDKLFSWGYESLEFIAAHSALCLDKRDPGPGLDWERLKTFKAKLIY